MWENLKKTPAMDVGQVSFHLDKDVRKIRVEKRINDIVNRLNKTKTEEHPGKCWKLVGLTEVASFSGSISRLNIFFHFNKFLDFRALREARDAKEREDKKKIVREQKEKEKLYERKRQEENELRSYASLMSSDKMKSNYDDGNDSDDFM